MLNVPLLLELAMSPTEIAWSAQIPKITTSALQGAASQNCHVVQTVAAVTT